MNILTVDSIDKAYGVRKIFDNASFYLQQGEKAGIIGKNGSGKSTLLKMIAGIDTPDCGNIVKANNLTVKYLPQTPHFFEDDSVLEAVVRDNKTTDNKWGIESDAKSMMTKLGITDFDEKCRNLSGGQQKRLALVSALLTKADLLLLDEPTNHLDSEMSSWLEGVLKAYKGSVIFITHDRYFLDNVSDRIIEIDKGKIYSYDDNYSGYLELKTMREESLEASDRKRRSILRVELEWVKRGARARSTKQKARLERYEELKAMQSPQKDETVEMGSLASRLGKTTIEIDNIKKAFDEKVLIKDFSYNFLKNDRIGIIGRNGCGKTTLLKMIMGEEKPDKGDIFVGPTVKIGYFSQMMEDIDPAQRVIDYIRDVAEYVDCGDGKITAAKLLENFLFKGEDQYGPIGKLSGGECRRLFLCKILMSAPNVLILDEPTNDLDIATLQVLEDYLDSFQGIVIAVSHDRYFLDRVVRRIFSFEDDGNVRQSEGGYTDYEIRKSVEGELVKSTSSNQLNNSKDNAEPKSTEAKKEVLTQKGKPRLGEKKLKFTYSEQREYETIEDDIAKLEEDIEAVDKEILKYASDFTKLEELTAKKDELANELAYKMDRWMYLFDLADKIREGKSKN